MCSAPVPRGSAPGAVGGKNVTPYGEKSERSERAGETGATQGASRRGVF